MEQKEKKGGRWERERLVCLQKKLMLEISSHGLDEWHLSKLSLHSLLLTDIQGLYSMNFILF